MGLAVQKVELEPVKQIIDLREPRSEMIFGQIYMMAGPSAKHQDTVLNIAIEIKQKGKCKPRVAPFDLKIECGNSESRVQPDVMIFCEDEELPCAIFEVLSPSTAVKDKKIKKKLYECAKIKEYFIVETEYNLIEKFELVDGEYKFMGNFSAEDKMRINCIDDEIDVAKVFEGE